MKTILLLQTDHLVLRLLRRILSHYRVLEASTAEEALQKFNENDRNIELLIADVSLPASSGIQVALLLRSELPDLQVILTSSHGGRAWTKQDAADLGRLGPDSVAILQKSFTREVLLSTVSCTGSPG